MNDIASIEQEALGTQLTMANERLHRFADELRSVDDELEGLSGERQRSQLVREACDALDQLSELGAAALFWGDRISPAECNARVQNVRQRIAGFEEKFAEVEARRLSLLDQIQQEQEKIELIEEELFEAQEEEERRKLEWIVEREISKLPDRKQVMPWSRGGEEDQRFHKALGIALLVSLVLSVLLPLVDLPIPERWQVVDVPERLARLVREERRLPPPPATIEEKPPEVSEPEPEPEPIEEPVTPTDQPVLANEPAAEPAPKKTKEKRAETKGILAFREKFSNLAANKPSTQLGAQARISSSGEAAAGRPERSMVTTQAPGSSGGINLASLSRDVGGGTGQAMAGVQLTRASSNIGGGGGEDRPLSNGAGAGRTDEEIQIVFDRHKAALYRMYNRELRKNPTLQGQMVLRIRIEPDGSVSMCELQGSDMNAPNLTTQVLGRVRTFNFGAKEVPAITILYPIDFLPAA
ncbi:MAG: AgmX/PglI C-terminal domain-containing protein [Gammaproteobacteria bacterium]|nr:MAG: AgmX/PglI C-terminal domain-containing protein [Gammaproteobacteria bacterium]